MRRRQVGAGAVERLLRGAASAGARFYNPRHAYWDVSHRCREAILMSFWAKDPEAFGETRSFGGTVEMVLPCRKCPPCLAVRQWRWCSRAIAECGMHPRTYFGTLTLSPEEHYAARCRVVLAAGEEMLIGDISFRQQAMEEGKLVTLWLKRVRADLNVYIRYLLVTEKHRNGSPHFHVLVHELGRHTDRAYDTYRVLKDQWTHGWSDFSGVDLESSLAPRYVTKYLTKSAEARVRASARYGSSDYEPPPENEVGFLENQVGNEMLTA